MRRLLWAALVAALLSSGCSLLYSWDTLEPSWMGVDAGQGGDAGLPFTLPDGGGFPFAEAAPPVRPETGRLPL